MAEKLYFIRLNSVCCNRPLSINHHKYRILHTMAKTKATKTYELPDVVPIIKNPKKYAMNLTVDKLVELLQSLSHYYYNTDEVAVPDMIFDTLYDVLKERDPDNKLLQSVGAPISKGTKVKLPHPMFSLDKIKPGTGELDKWKSRYPGPYVLSDKMDGVSALVRKNKNKKTKMYTRGNGIKGQDISYLIPHVLTDVKLDKLPVGVAVRGELEISKEDFKELQKEEDLKNARNTVAGLVNSKHYSLDLAQATSFSAYELVSPRMKKTDQLKALKKYGFEVVMSKTVTKDQLTEDYLKNYLKRRREIAEYDIDGIVVEDSSEVYNLVDKNPDYAFAFKMVLEDQVVVAEVVKVIWTASKHGLMKPKIEIKPVKLGGVTVKMATAFHGRFVKDSVLGPGAKIKLVRSGDVIPHILEVTKKAKSGKPQMPDVEYTWDKTNTNLIATSLEGEVKNTINSKTVANFFEKMQVKHISRGVSAKLVEAGYDTVLKVLKAKRSDLEAVDGLGSVIVEKLFSGVEEAVKKTNIAQLMAASMMMGQGIGVRKIKLVVAAYPNIMKVKWGRDEMIDKLKLIDGFETVTATKFTDNIGKFKTFYKELSKIVDLKHLDKKDGNKGEKNNKKVSRFAGEVVVFTGFRDKDAEAMIEEEGGRITGSVSKNTTLLVYGDKSSSKYKKAVEIGVKTMDKEGFLKRYRV